MGLNPKPSDRVLVWGLGFPNPLTGSAKDLGLGRSEVRGLENSGMNTSVRFF